MFFFFRFCFSTARDKVLLFVLNPFTRPINLVWFNYYYYYFFPIIYKHARIGSPDKNQSLFFDRPTPSLLVAFHARASSSRVNPVVVKYIVIN